ncbi:glycosyltransferase [Coprobacter sp.]
MLLFEIIDILMFCLFAVSVLYLALFSVAALFFRKKEVPVPDIFNSIAVFIPAYKEDLVIFDTVGACLEQNYPRDKYDVIVIADRMSCDTLSGLRKLPVILVEMPEEENTKAKALNLALNRIQDYDIAVVLDADNLCSPGFLFTINRMYESGYRAIQTHRKAKNIEEPFALLDAISEEINNTIFRKGHVTLGFSSALIGSGMAFDYLWFKKHMRLVHTAGEDKEIETLLLRERIKIVYLPDEIVLDEKVCRADTFYQQRRRWLSAQFYHMLSLFPELFRAVRVRNKDMVNKVIQTIVLPRVLLLGLLFLISLILSFCMVSMAIKWWWLLGILVCILLLATPREFFGKHLMKALFKLPVAFALMFANLFRIKGGNKRFVATEHGNRG